jgi:O-antigen ligase
VTTLAAGTLARARTAPIGLLLAAAVVGALVVAKPFYAVALVLGAAVVLVIARDAEALPLALVATMFTESLSLGPALRVGRLAGVLAIAVLAYSLLTHLRSQLRWNPLVALAVGYGIWMAVSLYWASDTHWVLTELDSWGLAMAYMLTFALLVRTPRQLTAILTTLSIGSFVFGLVSFATYASSNDTARGAGLQGDPNYFAVYQTIALPATLTLAATTRKPALRALLYCVVGVIVLSVVSSLSRGGLIALGVVVLATIVLPWRTFFRRRSQKASYVAFLGLAVAVAVMLGSTSFVARAQTIIHPSDRGSGRTDLWNAAWNAYSHHPWLGIGEGNFRAESLQWLAATPGVDLAAPWINSGKEVHNAYLETLTELGPVGLALFGGVILGTAWFCVRSYRRARAYRHRLLEHYSLAVVVGLLGYVVGAVFLSNELSKALWVLVGIALALDAMTRRLVLAAPAPVAPRRPRRPRRRRRRRPHGRR